MQATDRQRPIISPVRRAASRLLELVVTHRLGLLLAGALFILCWPVADRSGQLGLDRSWQLALHLAVTDHLRYGPQFLFTYGPLGFLTVPTPFVGTTSSLGLVYMAGLHASLCLAIAFVVGQIRPIWLALVLAYLAARTIAGLAAPDAEGIVVAVLVAALLVLDRRLTVPTPWLVGTFGLVTGIALLGKIDAGLIVAIVAGLAIVGSASRPARSLAAYVVVTLLATGVLWVLLGQRLGDLVTYVRGALEIVIGYANAMNRAPTLNLEWEPFGIVAAFVLAGWLVVGATANLDRRRRAAIYGACVVVALAGTKLALTRWVATPQPVLFTAVLFVILLYLRRGPHLEAGVISFVAVVICVVAVSPTSAVAFLNPVTNVRTLLRDGATVVLPGRADRAAARTVAQLREGLAVPAPVLAALVGRTVHVDPWETSVMAAYPELEWSPLPVFQSYSAYTPLLDSLNANQLSGPDAPAAILRTPVFPGSLVPTNGTIDSRYRWFEAPSAMLQAFCRYRESVISGSWQVLVRTNAYCGQATPLGTVSADPGAPVNVPPPPGPNSFVIVRIEGLTGSPLETIANVVLGAPIWQVVVDGQAFRLVRATAGDGLLLAVPPALRGSAPFDFGPPRTTISVRPAAGHDARPVRYAFFAVPWVPAGS